MNREIVRGRRHRDESIPRPLSTKLFDRSMRDLFPMPHPIISWRYAPVFPVFFQIQVHENRMPAIEDQSDDENEE